MDMDKEIEIGKRYLISDEHSKLKEIELITKTEKCYLIKFIDRNKGEDNIIWIKKLELSTEYNSYRKYNIYDDIDDKVWKPLEREKKLKRIID